jgi:hypothetical protein
MDGLSTSPAVQRAIETPPKGPDGRPLVTPEVRSDNGQRLHLQGVPGGAHGEQRDSPAHTATLPGREQSDPAGNWTLREGLEGQWLSNYLELERVLGRLRPQYNEEGCIARWATCRLGNSSVATQRVGSSSGASSCPGLATVGGRKTSS